MSTYLRDWLNQRLILSQHQTYAILFAKGDPKRSLKGMDWIGGFGKLAELCLI